jgi:cysteine desulfurase
LQEAIDDQTALVSVMLANNEIGVIQPLSEIAAMCRQKGCWLHSDATQAVGRFNCHVDQLGVDLLSFSAHKFYGPKGVGGLFVRRRERAVRLQPQIVGGGQQHNLRSGTLNTAGIVGMQAALQNTIENLAQDQAAIQTMRDRMYDRLIEIGGSTLNGPQLVQHQRLQGNLNCCFYPLEGQSLMMHAPALAVSSGSACTSANPEPSHVLRAIGLSEDQARSSLRFGFGRFNTLEEVDQAAQILAVAIEQLRTLR